METAVLEQAYALAKERYAQWGVDTEAALKRLEGIPISRIEADRLGPYTGRRDRDLYLVTKAGSFGSPDILASIRTSLGKR